VSQVETTPHEVEGRWKWSDWGRGPYNALSSVMLGPPFEGYLEITSEVDGEPWLFEVSYSKSGFAPRLSDGINAERLYEWDILGRGRDERWRVSPSGLSQKITAPRLASVRRSPVEAHEIGV
jgi:hypothetical protein